MGKRLAIKRLVKLIIWKTNKTKSQTVIKIKKIFQPKRTNKTPSVVATPFPPLNFSQTGKIWPKTGVMATEAICQSKLRRSMAKQTGITPFKISKAPTRAPHFKPKARITFVTPILPEPTFLISIPLALQIK